MKTHESRLNQAFELAGDVIDGQRALRAGVDELMKLQETTAAQGQVSTPTQDSIESEPASSNVDAGPEVPPERLVVTVPGAGSLYVLEEKNRPERRVLVTQNQERGNLAGRSNMNVRHQEAVETAGEARIRSRGENQLELKTDEVLEGWRITSDTSCEWRALGRQGVQELQRRRRVETRNLSDGQAQEQRRSVTQSHEVDFG